MRGASFLKRSLEDSVQLERIVPLLRAARDPQELVSVWWAHCDIEEGALRDALRDEYMACLRRLAPMQLAG